MIKYDVLRRIINWTIVRGGFGVIILTSKCK